MSCLKHSCVYALILFVGLISMSSVEACVRCEIILGYFSCGPGHEFGGYSCHFQYDPELQKETCLTIGQCQNYDPPDFPIDPYNNGSSDSATSAHQCSTGMLTTVAVESPAENQNYDDVPEIAEAILNTLQFNRGSLVVSPYYTGLIRDLDFNNENRTNSKAVAFEGGLVFDGDVNETILGDFTIFGHPSVSDIQFEFMQISQETINQGHKSNKSKSERSRSRSLYQLANIYVN